MNLPSGSVTFLSADIEGSAKVGTRDLQAFSEAIRRYDAIASEVLPLHSGALVRTIRQGDAILAAVSNSQDALEAARALLQTCQAEPLMGETQARLRVALHFGEAELYDGDYHGPAINHCLHLLSMAHGWQALISADCAAEIPRDLPLGMQLRDLGEHPLRDLSSPEHVYQLLYPGLPADFPSLRSLFNYANNLPLHADRFIGREAEMAEIHRLLTGTRLLTLIGAAGMGKTRLAQQAGADLLDAYPDGVWRADFAAITDPALVPQALATVLNIGEEPGKLLMQSLITALTAKRMLLLFDNCHALIPACARLAEMLLRSCPAIKILAACRQGLGVVGETSFLVPSLSLPEGGAVIAPAAVHRSEAAQLFLDRAACVVPDFAISTATASALARIVRRLDGIPLALELAAARLHTLLLEQIDSQLDACFRRLFGESHPLLPRQQTLQAAIEWSFDQFSAVEQALLCRLTIFRGGWTQEGAEAVCAWEGVGLDQVAAGLDALMDAGLLVEEQFGDEIRYQMPEAVSEYCRGFVEREERAMLRRYHAGYCLRLAQTGMAKLEGGEANAWSDRMEREQPNFRIALAWCQDDPEYAEMGRWLAETLAPFWQRRAYQSEGQSLLARLETERQGIPLERADALMASGEQALRQGDYPAAFARYEQALGLYQEAGDRRKEAQALHHLGIVARDAGDHITAQARHELALALHRELNDPDGEARHLHNLGNALKEQGDYERARSHYEQAYSRNWSAGNRAATAHNLNGLARVALAEQDKERARRLYTEALEIFQEINDPAWQAHNLREIVKLDLQSGLFWTENHK